MSELPEDHPMTTTGRPPHRYDDRLRDLVRRTQDVTIATDLGVPPSTARGWLSQAPKVVVSLDVTDLMRIPANLNAGSGDCERGFRASRTLIGAER